jgi:cysteine desulfurase family protein (TIGR01976 family)
MLAALDVAAVRREFPALSPPDRARPPVFLDGPAGSQVPQSVVDAMGAYILRDNANHGGAFATSRRTDAMVARARTAFADLVGASDPEEIVFGANMTTLTFHLAKALARTWRPGDEVVVTDSDHDANVMPWVLAARGAGCEVERIRVNADSTLDLDDAARTITAKTRLVAVGAASNLSGTIHPVRAIAALARARGAAVFVDAVHLAPHARLDVQALGCDFLALSAYKLFGPHVGVLWGRRALLEQLAADKVRPAPDHGAEKWQTGTACFEGIAGALAAVQYLERLGSPFLADSGGGRRAALDAAFGAIERHERPLCARLLAGLAAIPGVRVVGLGDAARAHERCPTVSFVARRVPPAELARSLAERGVYAWAGNSYAIALSAALGLEPLGALRLGLLHYNTAEEVDRVLAELRTLLA